MSLRDIESVKPINSLPEESETPPLSKIPSISDLTFIQSTSKPPNVISKLPTPPVITEKREKSITKLPSDCRKQLFVSIPPVKASTSAASMQPSTSKKRNSMVFEATSFSKLAFDNDPSSPQVRNPISKNTFWWLLKVEGKLLGYIKLIRENISVLKNKLKLLT